MLRASIAEISSDVQFSAADLQSQLVRIEKEEADAARQLEAAEAAQTELDKHYAEARKKRDAAAQVTPAWAEEVTATKLAHDCQARQIAMLQKRVELLGQVGTAWRRRFAVAVGRFEIADLATWKAEGRQAIEQLTGERHIANMIAEQARNESADLNQRLEDVADRDAELVDWIRKEQATIERLIDAVEEHLVKLDVQTKLQEKLLHEIAEKAELHWLARWVAAAQDTYRAIASTEVATADDRSVTIGKITQALLMLIMGIVVALADWTVWPPADDPRRHSCRRGVGPAIVGLLRPGRHDGIVCLAHGARAVDRLRVHGRGHRHRRRLRQPEGTQ